MDVVCLLAGGEQIQFTGTTEAMTNQEWNQLADIVYGQTGNNIYIRHDNAGRTTVTTEDPSDEFVFVTEPWSVQTTFTDKYGKTMIADTIPSHKITHLYNGTVPDDFEGLCRVPSSICTDTSTKINFTEHSQALKITPETKFSNVFTNEKIMATSTMKMVDGTKLTGGLALDIASENVLSKLKQALNMPAPSLAFKRCFVIETKLKPN